MDLQKEIEDIYPHVVALRRHLHQYPETGMETFQTAGYAAAELERLGIPYRMVDDVGIIAEIKGKSEGKTVMLRADLDALHVEEKTGLPFASRNEGKMHACGHDMHTAMLLGTAAILKKHQDTFAGTVRLLFQPGEEISRGAVALIKAGALDNVSYGFGLHMDPLAPAHRISSCIGPDWAAVDHFRIVVKGKGAHGATPQKGHDALVAACAIVNALQTMVSRESDPMQPLVVTVGKFHAGTSYNIIAEEAELEGTCRSFDEALHERIPGMLERIAKGVAEAYGCEAELFFTNHSRPLVNDARAYEILHHAALKVVPEENWHVRQPEMIGEDFSEYASRIPCVFAHLGGDAGYALHSCHIQFREETMKTGMALEVQFALDALDC